MKPTAPQAVTLKEVLGERSVRHVAPSEKGVICTESFHEACFIGTVTGQKCAVVNTGRVLRNGAPEKRWFFDSTPLADEAKALWTSVGLPQFGTPKDWDAMTLDERKAVTNVLTAFAGNLRLYLAHTKEP